MHLVKVFYCLSIVFMIFILAACDVTSPASDTTSISTPFSQPSSELEHPSTLTAMPSSTPLPSATLDTTQTARSQAIISTQIAEEILMASFPRVCTENFISFEISPNKLWMADQCFSESEQSPILTISNRESQVLWKLTLRDYMYAERPDSLWYAAFSLAYWSDDGKYIYFASSPIIDGGECYLGRNSQYFGKGLFRLDLQAGTTTTLLPLQNNLRNYDFSFSPTGRWLIYKTYSSDLMILDIKTGESISVKSADNNQFGGGYLWSSDGLKFIYSTALYDDNGPVNYSLRLVDSQSGNESILFESSKACFVARSWLNDHAVIIESYGDNLNQAIIEYDLKSNKVISEATATPRP